VVTDALTTNDLIIHGFAKNESDAAYRAVSAGVNVDMASRILAGQLAGLVKTEKSPWHKLTTRCDRCSA